MKKPLSKGAMVVVYSTVFILIGMIFTDVTTQKHYLPNILITLGLGWVFMVLLSKNSVKKPLVLEPKPEEQKNGLDVLADKIADHIKKIETDPMFCFKCQTIHDSNSVCNFDSNSVCNFDFNGCEHEETVKDCQTDESFCIKCGKILS